MLLGLIATLVLLGLIAWGVSLLPIPQPFKTGIFVILVIVAFLIVIRAFGIGLVGIP